MGVETGVTPGISTGVAMGAATGVWQTGGNLIANDRPGIWQHIHRTGGSRNPSKKFSIFLIHTVARQTYFMLGVEC